MRVRKRYLPPGWYPSQAEQVEGDIERMQRPAPRAAANGIAGIVPHAGWEYSGALALEVFSCMFRSMDTIVIIGGHLGPSDGIMCCTEDAYETPLGEIRADAGLLERLRGEISMREDRHADNTVEVHLPLVRHCFPAAMALGLRASPSVDAVTLGAAIAGASEALGRRTVVVGSTDLTHYGPNYGFAPAGTGQGALKWVRDVNDRQLIERMLALDLEGTRERALRDRSACSAGGALAAMSFARACGATAGTLLNYMTSYDVSPAASFVGYAGILFACPS
jgi:AmmeMemoRadiSam system protein B